MAKKPCTIQECPNNLVALGLCSAHYRRLRLYGDPNQRKHTDLSKTVAFWSQVSVTANQIKCWIWTGRCDDDGYGAISISLDGVRYSLAHRLAYRLFYGINPAGFNVCHNCDRPGCVNPHHLFLGTQKINIADMMSKGRSSKGEHRPLAKLDSAKVLAIRKRLRNGERLKYIAQDYGVSPNTIRQIKLGNAWKHITN